MMVLASAFLAVSLATPVFAEEFGGNPATKLTRGVINLTTGWLEIPARMAEQKETDSTQVWWFFHGLFRGITVGATRTIYGLWETVTFPIAPYNAPFMEPDTLIKPKQKPRDLEPTSSPDPEAYT